MATYRPRLVPALALLLVALAPAVASAAPETTAPSAKPAPTIATKDADDREVEGWTKDAPKATPAQNDSIADRVAKTYGGSREDVLKETKGGKRSWGQVTMAHEMAKQANRPVDEVWAMRDKGQGWGQIAHAYGTNVGDVKKSAKRNMDTWRAGSKGHGAKGQAGGKGQASKEGSGGKGHGSKEGSGSGERDEMKEESGGKHAPEADEHGGADSTRTESGAHGHGKGKGGGKPK